MNQVTITAAQIAQRVSNEMGWELADAREKVSNAIFMLGVQFIGPMTSIVKLYSAADGERIIDWIAGNGGQDIDGGVY